MRYFFRYIWFSLCLFLGIQPAFALPSIIETATITANNLPLDGQGSASIHIVKVADLELSTSHPLGLTLTVGSGSIEKASGTPIAYQVTTVVDGSPPPSSADFTTSPGSNYVVATNSAGSSSKDLYIKYTPAALQDPGAYNTSISLVVTDN